MHELMTKFQNQFVEVIKTSGKNHTHIADMWGTATEKQARSLQTQLTRWLRQLPKTIETLVVLLECLDYRLHIEPHPIGENAITEYQTRFVDCIDATDLSHGRIGKKYGLSTKTNPEAMRVTLGRWLKNTPQAIAELVVVLNCLDYRLVIERKP